MSTGGNVPQQGVDVQVLAQVAKRGDRGKLGECRLKGHDHVNDGKGCVRGTPGGRLKALWRKGPHRPNMSLMKFVRALSKQDRSKWESTAQGRTAVDDALEWLDSKRNGGGKAVREAKRARRQRIALLNAPKSDAGKATIKVPKKGSGRGDRTDDRG